MVRNGVGFIQRYHVDNSDRGGGSRVNQNLKMSKCFLKRKTRGRDAMPHNRLLEFFFEDVKNKNWIQMKY